MYKFNRLCDPLPKLWKIATSFIVLLLLPVWLSFAVVTSEFDKTEKESRTPMVGVQQGILISGTVTDENSEPLPGVNVMLKGTTQGTVTDINGKYRITVPGADSELTFTFVGYSEQTIPVGDRIVINVDMVEGAIAIEEVEIIGIGYGSIRQRDITGSIAVADMNEIQKMPVASVLEGLAGRVSGVQIISADGAPGEGSHVVIRGGSSITGDNNPLYVVDGFPQIEGFDLGTLSPSEIESLTVLKDASSTAIYGSRGANGVIIVTTKRGTVSRKPRVTYEGTYGMDNVTKRMEMMSPYEFVRLEYDRNGSSSFVSNDMTLEDYKDLKGINWQDRLFRRVWPQTHKLYVRGGTESTQYSISGSYLDQDGVVITSNYKRYTMRVRVDQQFSKWLKAGVTLSYGRRIYAGIQPRSISVDNESLMDFYPLYGVWAYRPINYPHEDLEDLEDELGDPLSESSASNINPIRNITNQYRKRYSNELSADAYLDFKITEHLSFKTIGQVYQSLGSSESFNNSFTSSGHPLGARKVNGSIYHTDRNNWVNENILTYTKSFKGLRVTATGAATFEKYGASNNGFRASNIPIEQKEIAGIADGLNYGMTSSIDPGTQRISFLGRAILDYQSRYLATVSMRADGSSRFAKGNRWGYFPSASLAWNFNKEEFLKDQNILSNGKLRASWGWTGNDRINSSDRYQQMATSFTYSYPRGDEWSASAFISNPGNEALKWERTEQTNIGIDLGFLKGKIALTVDAYRKNTHDLLLRSSLPHSTGFGVQTKNVGQVRNQGLEFTVSTVNIANKSFRWNTNFNIAFNQNKVIALAEGQQCLFTAVSFDKNFSAQAPYIAIIGKPVGAFYGYVWDGIYRSDEFDTNSDSGIYALKPGVPAFAATNHQPGDIKYRDVNGDGVVDDFDRQVIGSPDPLFLGGMNNTFSYKGFDLSVFFRWSYGNEVLNANRLAMENGTRTRANQFATYANRWTPDHQDTDMHRANSSGVLFYSSRVIEDASFLRLQMVAFGYSFPKAWLKKASIGTLKLSLAANNLWTWTNYSGYDPEVSTRHSALTPAFDYSSFARARSLTLTLNISF